MPKAFNRCVSRGGRVRTKSLGGDKYIHLCFSNGKSVAGHTKTRKSSKRK